MAKKKAKNKGYIVSIDGPAGAGKSTVSRLLAKKIKGRLLDTGATYRLAAYIALQEDAQTEAQYEKICRRLKFSWAAKGRDILVNGQKLGKKIRTEKVSEMASYISTFPKVRRILTQQQRQLGKEGAKRFPVVVEGRDIGTVVFPDGEFKFFVTAIEKVRAKRRFDQLRKDGEKVTLRTVLKQVKARDKQDSRRKFAPLRCPQNAIVVDTSEMEIPEVVKFMSTHISSYQRAHRKFNYPN